MIEVRNLTKVFTSGFLKKTRIVAVDNVSFKLYDKSPTILTLAGESGSGKTTIAKLILGFIKPTKGEVLYKGKNIWKMSNTEWKEYRKNVQAVFQDPYSSFNPLKKVDNVLWTPIKKFKITRSKDEALELINKSLEAVGLRSNEVLGKYPHELSGGQRQRLLLARAFLIKPSLIVADEPVSMIDASLRANILNLMLDLKKKLGVSFIYITHDLSTAHYVSDQIIILYRGSIMEMGAADKVIYSPKHPYTKILIESIPVPDPSRRWRKKIVIPETRLEQIKSSGCKFYNRCPVKTAKCITPPPLIKIEENHWVACHRYS